MVEIWDGINVNDFCLNGFKAALSVFVFDKCLTNIWGRLCGVDTKLLHILVSNPENFNTENTFSTCI